MRRRLEAIARRRSQQLTRRPDIRDIGKFPQHGVQPLRDILGNAVEQEGRRSHMLRAALPRLQQDAVEQFWRGIRGRGHAGWYAARSISGNPAFRSARVWRQRNSGETLNPNRL
jgi:hypothetical protein